MESQDPILPGCEAQKQHCSDSSITVTGPGKQRLTLALRILSQIHPRGCFRMKSSFGCMWTSLSSLFYYYFFLYSWKWLFAQNILSVGCPGKKKVNKIVFFFHAFGTSEDPFLCKRLNSFCLVTFLSLQRARLHSSSKRTWGGQACCLIDMALSSPSGRWGIRHDKHWGSFRQCGRARCRWWFVQWERGFWASLKETCVGSWLLSV